MFALSIAMLGCAVAIALWRWEMGVYAAVVTAFVQDPMRKLTDGKPVLFIVFAGVVFGAAIVSARQSGVRLGLDAIVGWRRNLRTPFVVFAALVLVQAVNAFIQVGNPTVSALGLFSYLGPFVALGPAYAFAASGGRDKVRNFLIFYLICGVLALGTVGLEASGVSSDVFGPVGKQLIIYDSGGILSVNCGIFRAAEIAGWHSANCACVAVILFTHRRFDLKHIALGILLAAALVSLGVLTGRRKLLVVAAIFGCVYFGLIAAFVRRSIASAFLFAGLGLLAYFLWTAGLIGGGSAEGSGVSHYAQYWNRGGTGFSDISKRFFNLGLTPIGWAYDWFGFWGGGVGVGTQGVQNIVRTERYIGAAEGGLGKITLELGVPGLLAAGYLALGIMRRCFAILVEAPRSSLANARLACGLAAILVANAANYTVATQTYGDVFVLMFLGIVFGSLLAIPTFRAERRVAGARRAPWTPTIHVGPPKAAFKGDEAGLC